jgi:hypothetical protein
LSVEAVHDSETLVAVAPVTDSGQALVAAVSDACPERLPAAS